MPLHHDIDSAEVLVGVSPQTRTAPTAAVHGRKDQVLAPATAQALAHLTWLPMEL